MSRATAATRILPVEPPRSRSSSPSDPNGTYELDDAAATVDEYGRIVVTLRSRSRTGRYAIPVGRSAVVSRIVLGRASQPDHEPSRPPELPPPPDGMTGWVVPAAPPRHSGNPSRRPIVLYASVIVALLVLAWVALHAPRNPQPLAPTTATP